MERSSLVGPTLIGYFERIEDARQCVYELRGAGFEEDAVGFARGPLAAVVTVLPGDRWEAARRVIGQPRAPVAERGFSAIREAVDRARRRR